MFKDVDVDGIRLKMVADDIPVEDNLGAPTNPLLSFKAATNALFSFKPPTNPLFSVNTDTDDTDASEPAMDETSSKFLWDKLNILHCFLYTSHCSGKPFCNGREKLMKNKKERKRKQFLPLKATYNFLSHSKSQLVTV